MKILTGIALLMAVCDRLPGRGGPGPGALCGHGEPPADRPWRRQGRRGRAEPAVERGAGSGGPGRPQRLPGIRWGRRPQPWLGQAQRRLEPRRLPVGSVAPSLDPSSGASGRRRDPWHQPTRRHRHPWAEPAGTGRIPQPEREHRTSTATSIATSTSTATGTAPSTSTPSPCGRAGRVPAGGWPGPGATAGTAAGPRPPGAGGGPGPPPGVWAPWRRPRSSTVPWMRRWPATRPPSWCPTPTISCSTARCSLPAPPRSAFDVSADGSVYQLSADCQSGLLNGQVPGNAQEAELLNAACQVAFGTAS